MVKDLPVNAEDTGLIPRLEDPPEKNMETHSSILTWKFHGQRSLAGYSKWSHKESYTTEVT